MADTTTERRRVAVIAAGGTGGHLFPAQALAEALISRGWKIVLATDERVGGLTQAFPAERVVELPAATARRGDPASAVNAASVILRGVMEGRKALAEVDPSVVVGFGGYPSVPALIAAFSQRRPTVIHEQNAVSGRANRLLAPFATQIACAFPGLAKASRRTDARKVVVGNPVRPEIRGLAGKGYAPPTGEIRVLVTGGSQGARLLSELIPAALAALPEPLRLRLRVEQQARQESLEGARRAYADALIQAEVAPFFRDMAARLERAHLVIGRAGASTVTELMAAGRPAILVPLGIALDNDQGRNAAILAQAGGAEVRLERDLDLESTTGLLSELLSDPARLARMAAAAASLARPDAAERLADLVERTAGGARA
ncbi:MAG: undecaprenyldiphospho-muramoylpentapeptide beta-N-acetylglucosaminyltransferase [Caulobacteraceae bacterium]|nr:undecaprenyldiphospho-muramoylpentapeptide beta-N-acetylglucosaminyltransferase [Caulobacteraceae bacterium]